ncbi:hypothetical protein KKF60_00610 [Patescibacteria group bacterium]|nr:hypothetical protein [Patescibacteria group bacterium]MBU4458400.1 hypothetical protein [Patescibacteria group bacterium]MCG2695845.1 hypothetical protein [Candidatus Portnoybacteria bacterium]
MSRTTFSIPGWYVEFRSSVLRQLPRPGDGLQNIDQITAGGWVKNQAALKNVLAQTLIPPKSVSPEKFGLFIDLGIITVPDNYVHDTQLASFEKKNHDKFRFYDDDITDKNFAKVTTKLVPGQKFHVKVFKLIGATTVKERLAFYKSQNAALVGAQGISLIFEQKRNLLSRGLSYYSFNEKEALWIDTDGHYRMPFLDLDLIGNWGIGLDYLNYDWSNKCLICCFYLI